MERMVSVRRISLMEKFLLLWPPRRKRMDKETREAIRYLITHPEQPCMVTNRIIPNGYGELLEDWLK